MELRAAISLHLIKLATEKAVKWACQKPLAPLLIETVRSGDGDIKPIYSSLCERLVQPLVEGCGHLVSDPCGHWVIKSLLAVHRKGT